MYGIEQQCTHDICMATTNYTWRHALVLHPPSTILPSRFPVPSSQHSSNHPDTLEHPHPITFPPRTGKPGSKNHAMQERNIKQDFPVRLHDISHTYPARLTSQSTSQLASSSTGSTSPGKESNPRDLFTDLYLPMAKRWREETSLQALPPSYALIG
jgi:hypothetical protein